MIAIVVPFAGLLAVLLVAEQGDPPAHRKAGGDGSAAAMVRPAARRPGSRFLARSRPRSRRIGWMSSTGPRTGGSSRARLVGVIGCAVRPDRIPGTGWLAVEPLATTICWIEQSSLELEEGECAGRDGSGGSPSRPRPEPDGACLGQPSTGGDSIGPSAGPAPRAPPGRIAEGDDGPACRPPCPEPGPRADEDALAGDRAAPDQVFFVHADGVRWLAPHIDSPDPAGGRSPSLL